MLYNGKRLKLPVGCIYLFSPTDKLMRNSKILAKHRAGQPIRIAMLGHYVPSYIAFAAANGYDGIWLDLEHRPMDTREIQSLLGFFHLYDIDCMLRPPTTGRGQLVRFLEDGAAGLMIPHVSGVEMVRELVRKTKFPPIGDRGVEGRGLDAGYAISTGGDWNKLVEHARRETFLAIQIETLTALAEVEEIAATPGVDFLFVGPSDLTLRLNQLPTSERVTIDDVYRRVDAACRANGLAWGSMPRTTEQVQHFTDLGARIHIWGNDQKLLMDGLAQSANELNTILK